ncbi:MAG TPA: AraC family transcriptional regulator [Fimbriimonadaceae bacterium]|nr:AraC family transcriptional regulator [Fimbriimonadaceae bacterium]
MPVLFNPPAEKVCQSNAIVAGRATRHFVPSFVGTHSIKAVLSGAAEWQVDGRARRVTPHWVLPVNKGERYSLTIESTTPVQTCCAFFAPGFLEGVKSEVYCDGDLELLCRYEPNSNELRKLLVRTWNAVVEGDALESDASMFDLAAALLRVADAQSREKHLLPLRKPKARDDVYQRLNASRDYMVENLSTPISLDSCAAVACMAPFHFHRLFKACYGEPVSAFVRRIRMDKAARLLKNTDLAVDGIALDCGYQSGTAFTRAFNLRFGCSPSHFRKNC